MLGCCGVPHAGDEHGKHHVSRSCVDDRWRSHYGPGARRVLGAGVRFRDAIAHHGEVAAGVVLALLRHHAWKHFSIAMPGIPGASHKGKSVDPSITSDPERDTTSSRVREDQPRLARYTVQRCPWRDRAFLELAQSLRSRRRFPGDARQRHQDGRASACQRFATVTSPPRRFRCSGVHFPYTTNRNMQLGQRQVQGRSVSRKTRVGRDQRPHRLGGNRRS